MTCKEIKDLIALAVFDELAPSEAEDLHAHIADCEDCRKAYDEALATVSVLRDTLQHESSSMKLDDEHLNALFSESATASYSDIPEQAIAAHHHTHGDEAVHASPDTEANKPILMRRPQKRLLQIAAVLCIIGLVSVLVIQSDLLKQMKTAQRDQSKQERLDQESTTTPKRYEERYDEITLTKERKEQHTPSVSDLPGRREAHTKPYALEENIAQVTPEKANEGSGSHGPAEADFALDKMIEEEADAALSVDSVNQILCMFAYHTTTEESQTINRNVVRTTQVLGKEISRLTGSKRANRTPSAAREVAPNKEPTPKKKSLREFAARSMDAAAARKAPLARQKSNDTETERNRSFRKNAAQTDDDSKKIEPTEQTQGEFQATAAKRFDTEQIPAEKLDKPAHQPKTPTPSSEGHTTEIAEMEADKKEMSTKQAEQKDTTLGLTQRKTETPRQLQPLAERKAAKAASSFYTISTERKPRLSVLPRTSSNTFHLSKSAILAGEQIARDAVQVQDFSNAFTKQKSVPTPNLVNITAATGQLPQTPDRRFLQIALHAPKHEDLETPPSHVLLITDHPETKPFQAFNRALKARLSPSDQLTQINLLPDNATKSKPHSADSLLTVNSVAEGLQQVYGTKRKKGKAILSHILFCTQSPSTVTADTFAAQFHKIPELTTFSTVLLMDPPHQEKRIKRLYALSEAKKGLFVTLTQKQGIDDIADQFKSLFHPQALNVQLTTAFNVATVKSYRFLGTTTDQAAPSLRPLKKALKRTPRINALGPGQSISLFFEYRLQPNAANNRRPASSISVRYTNATTRTRHEDVFHVKEGVSHHPTVSDNPDFFIPLTSTLFGELLRYPETAPITLSETYTILNSIKQAAPENKAVGELESLLNAFRVRDEKPAANMHPQSLDTDQTRQ